MSQNYASRFLETIGIEIESEILDRNSLVNLSVNKFDRLGIKMPYQVSRDASTESIIDYIAFRSNQRTYFQVNTHNKLYQKLLRPVNHSTGGYELIFNPLTLAELKPAIYRLENILQELGDSVTNRSAIHFHIGFAHNLRLMKKVLSVCLKIDPLLFRLGGFGRTFRGKSNLAAYARPLMNSCAVPLSGEIRLDGQRRNAVPVQPEFDDEDEENDSEDIEEEVFVPRRSSTEFVQVINPMGALAAETTDSFWANFGVFPSILGIPKYHPSRYTGCNLYAILAHGTMEFRHFNQVLDGQLIFTTAKFLRAIVELSTELRKSELAYFSPTAPENEISMDDVSEIMWQLGRYFAEKDVTDAPTEAEMDYLTRIMDNSHFESLPKIPVLTHIRDFSLPENLAIGLKRVENPLKPSHVDIHTIKVSSILPTGD